MKINDLPAAVVESKPPAFQLKKLGPKHKNIASLLAQGANRGEIAQIAGVTPEYVTMLSKDALVVQYMKEMSEFANTRLEAMFEKSVDTISAVMDQGSAKERLAAARLQMEAIKKIGKADVKITHEHSLVAILSSMPPERAVVPIRDTSTEKVVSEQ